jgi:hypothetical protein
MKNLAKLVLFFSLCFAILFLAALMLRLLSSWLDLARFIPLGPRPGEDATEAAWKALPAALYLSVLLTLSYTARRNMPIPLAIICILVLGFAFSAGISLGINRSGAMRLALLPVSSIQGGPGLILSRSDNSVILLRGSGDARGPRVVSIPGRPLIYQELPLGPNNTILELPPLSLGEEEPWFVRSMGLDFSLSAAELKSRLSSSFLSFAAYAFSLTLLLASLRFLLELSQWPLANLFLGALVFRGILALESFLNAREINALIGSFLTERVPPMLITPAVFTALGFLVIFYTLLTRITRRPGRGEDRDD